MNKRVLTGLYLGLWAAIALGVVYVITAAGHSLFLAGASAYLAFVLGNGTLAYVSRSRQLRLEGKQPPPYLLYVFFPKGLHKTIAVPRLVRMLLGTVVLVGGILFVTFGSVMAVSFEFMRAPHPIRVAALVLILVSMGLGFTYVGFRLIVVERGEALFKRRRPAKSEINTA